MEAEANKKRQNGKRKKKMSIFNKWEKDLDTVGIGYLARRKQTSHRLVKCVIK